jgi:hypothetical protein
MKLKTSVKLTPNPVTDPWKDVTYPCIIRAAQTSEGVYRYTIATGPSSGMILDDKPTHSDGGGTWQHYGWEPVPKNETVVVELSNNPS